MLTERARSLGEQLVRVLVIVVAGGCSALVGDPGSEPEGHASTDGGRGRPSGAAGSVDPSDSSHAGQAGGAGTVGVDAGISGIANQTGLPRSYHYVTADAPEPNDAVECNGATNSSAQIDHVYLAQTHLMEPGYPLFFLIADRPALAKVDLTGTGASPEVRMTGWIKDRPLGSICLRGPATLAPSIGGSKQSREGSFTATLPKAWLAPGLRLEVKAGDASKTYSVAQLGVGAAPEINLAMIPIDVLNYNDGKKDRDVPSTFLSDVATALPASRVRLGMFPARVSLNKLVTGGGDDPTGKGVAPVVLEKRPCGSNEDPASQPCVHVPPGLNDGQTVNASVMRYVEALIRGTGEYAYTYYYGNTENFFPGGWGGSHVFTGADFTDVFIHEMGHSLGLPHWGQGAYKPKNPTTEGYSYPYGGVNDDGGGRGDTWSYAPNSDTFYSPICQDPKSKNFGKERSDAMQRNVPCIEYASGKAGPWDGHSDFSALAMFRFMVGTSKPYAASVPYSRVGMAPFYLGPQSGFPVLKLDADGRRSLVRSDPTLRPEDWETLPFSVPQEWDVPVYTIYGTYHPAYPAATLIYDPLQYEGGLPAVIDPTDARTFAELEKGNAGAYKDHFASPHDLTFKFAFEDGTFLQAIFTGGGADRNWSLGAGPWRADILYWAITIPARVKLKRIELYLRPLVVRSPNDQTEGNINYAPFGITPDSFLTGAHLVASKDIP
jgi:Peptidase M66